MSGITFSPIAASMGLNDAAIFIEIYNRIKRTVAPSKK